MQMIASSFSFFFLGHSLFKCDTPSKRISSRDTLQGRVLSCRASFQHKEISNIFFSGEMQSVDGDPHFLKVNGDRVSISTFSLEHFPEIAVEIKHIFSLTKEEMTIPQKQRTQKNKRYFS
jgi:hypothetical protein